MLVSHRKRFIYTKTLKTGGTSAEAYLEPFCMPDGEWSLTHFRQQHVSEAGIIGFRGYTPDPRTVWFNHMSAAAIKEQVGDGIWNSYYKFCVIRSPYEKAISAFFFFRSNGNIALDHIGDDRAQFTYWLQNFGPPIDRDKYLIDGRFCLDGVLRHETLTADLAALCRRLDLPWQPENLPTFKAGVRPAGATLASLYTEHAKAIVDAAYAFELDHFGYRFPEEIRLVA